MRSKNRKFSNVTFNFLQNKIIQFVMLGSGLVLLLLLFYFLSSFLSEDKHGIDYKTSQVLKVAIVCCVTWIIMRLFRVVLMHSHKYKTVKNVSHYIIVFFNWGVSLGAVIFIAIVIFEQASWGFLTAGGIVGAGIAFSVQGIVLDIISGLVLALARSYKTGDWICLNEKMVGEIVKTSWRHIEVRTKYNSAIVIPNRHLTSEIYENLSRFGKIYRQDVNISLGHDIPIERAEAVLTDALLRIPEVTKTGLHEVWAEYVGEGGIRYTLRFGYEGLRMMRPIRHKVLLSATKILHENNMHVSEKLGSYSLSKTVPYFQSDPMPAKDFLRKITLFKVLTEDEIEKLVDHIDYSFIEPGDDLIVIDDVRTSLFIIAEGVVDVIIPLKEGEKLINKVLATLGAGNFVGERSLLMGEKRSATVRARTQILAYKVTKEAFEPLLKARPKIVDALAEALIEREQDTFEKIRDIKDIDKKRTLKEELVQRIKEFFGV